MMSDKKGNPAARVEADRVSGTFRLATNTQNNQTPQNMQVAYMVARYGLALEWAAMLAPFVFGGRA